MTLAHDIGNQMKQKELTKPFIDIAFKLIKAFDLHGLYTCRR